MAMLTIIEKVILLQNVDVFTRVPSEQLAYLAAIGEELTLHKGETVYTVGDPSDGLYVVIDGRVRLHQGENEILSAGAGEAFGVWALFDNEPRLTAATASEDARLLRIGREEFVDLLADNVQITQAILNTMVGRLRGLVDRVGAPPTPPVQEEPFGR